MNHAQMNRKGKKIDYFLHLFGYKRRKNNSIILDRDERAISATEEKYGLYCTCIASNILELKEDVEEQAQKLFAINSHEMRVQFHILNGNGYINSIQPQKNQMMWLKIVEKGVKLCIVIYQFAGYMHEKF